MFDPLILHRLASALRRAHIPKIPGLIQRLNFMFTGCDLPPAARIGRGVVFKHYGAGVIIHHRTEIGDGCVIMPHVVIGQQLRGVVPVALERIVIGHEVMIGAGAKIIAKGLFTIGDGAVIGANAVVLKSVPAGFRAVGVPARNLPPSSTGSECDSSSISEAVDLDAGLH